MEQKKDTAQQILQAAADAVVQQPVSLSVTLTETRPLRRLLQRWALLPRIRTLEVRPLTLGTLLLISRRLLAIDPDIMTKGAVLEGNYRMAAQHGEDIAAVIAQAVHNAPGEAPKRLQRLVLEHFTPQDLIQVLNVVVHQMNLNSFMIAIASVRGLNILEKANPEASPMTGTETIAPGTSSEAP